MARGRATSHRDFRARARFDRSGGCVLNWGSACEPESFSVPCHARNQSPGDPHFTAADFDMQWHYRPGSTWCAAHPAPVPLASATGTMRF